MYCTEVNFGFSEIIKCLRHLLNFDWFPDDYPHAPIASTVSYQCRRAVALLWPPLGCPAAHFGCLCLPSHSFGHYPELMTICEIWDVDRSVNWKLCLLAQFSSPQQTSVASASLPTLLQSACKSHTTRPVVGNQPFSRWEPWPQI